jgi:hypothetical protein
MGDIADSYIEDMERGYEDDEYWEMYGNTSTRPRPSITCKYCKKRGFHWEKTPNGWRLFDHIGMHYCKEREANASQTSKTCIP